MVYINSQKFACESCIKGHRSSACAHSERPLFEIPKKGRPLSQCDKCRELRKTRRHHSKCVCPKELPSRGIPLPSSSSTRKYIPIRPALPNGLRDLDQAVYSYSPPDVRQQVGTLLNPCHCKPGRKCKCRTPSQAGPRPPTPVASTSKAAPPHTHPRPPSPGPRLAPMLTISSPDHLTLETPIPEFSTQLPSMLVMNSLAGSGCTCGVECSCPGCLEHRGPAHASASGHRSCADGCGTCVDAHSGIEFALPGSSAPGPASSIERFLARAAALPRPPVRRTDVVNLPKLQCCGGRCACPDGACGCGKSCDGCCQEDPRQQAPSAVPVSAERSTRTPPRKSCCGA
ncbi:copper fist DNA binding domain-containing protein [Mycena belliarum]|uniref:Copper fist DNA binding domain-containing protein n=1 Tax=Mycena belliarum TaxID=1033014 RepID=A0AAD6TML1_9AGAR|nr:copper fist DNA binding domain-containing protein [Mycena belliae]